MDAARKNIDHRDLADRLLAIVEELDGLRLFTAAAHASLALDVLRGAWPELDTGDHPT